MILLLFFSRKFLCIGMKKSSVKIIRRLSADLPSYKLSEEIEFGQGKISPCPSANFSVGREK